MAIQVGFTVSNTSIGSRIFRPLRHLLGSASTGPQIEHGATRCHEMPRHAATSSGQASEETGFPQQAAAHLWVQLAPEHSFIMSKNLRKQTQRVQSRNSVVHLVMRFARFLRHFFGMQPGLFLTTAWCCSIALVERWSSARLVVGFSGDFLKWDACVAGTAALTALTPFDGFAL